MKILLLNPPNRVPYIRDYLSASASKAGYYYQPVDLLTLSGKLAGRGEIRALDAIVEGLSDDAARRRIRDFDPDLIISLVGTDCWDEDIAFLSSVKGRGRLVAMGAAFMHNARDFFEKNPILDAILFDFCNDDILNWIDAKYDAINWLMYRKDGEIVFVRRPYDKFYRIGVPKHELFPLTRYRIPHGKERHFTSILTSFGCAFACTFCDSTYDALNLKLRHVDDTIAELKHIRSLGIREIYIRDFLFTGHKKNASDLCRAIIDEKLDIEWICLSRVDTCDEALLELMKKAGCHTIQFGVESGNQAILDSIGKRTTVERIKQIFLKCDELGIRTLAHFILGLPGETRATIEDTIRLAREIRTDVASFNIAMPLFGTKLRDEVIAKGLYEEMPDKMDTAVSRPVIRLEGITPDELVALRRRAIFSFYLDPAYIFRRLTRLRSVHELRSIVLDGFGLLKNTLFEN